MLTPLRRLVGGALAVLMFVGAHAGAALAHGTKAAVTIGDLQISKVWSRATPKGAKVGAGYLQIKNVGDAPDRLISITSPIAGAAQIHTMKIVDGVMQMRELEGGLEIPAGGSVDLKPGGNHVMFMKLADPIEKDGHFKATLTFEKAGEISVEFATYGIGKSPETATTKKKKRKKKRGSH